MTTSPPAPRNRKSGRGAQKQTAPIVGNTSPTGGRNAPGIGRAERRAAQQAAAQRRREVRRLVLVGAAAIIVAGGLALITNLGATGGFGGRSPSALLATLPADGTTLGDPNAPV